jgi:ribosomal protein S18 acetylase RimI-like enzyme
MNLILPSEDGDIVRLAEINDLLYIVDLSKKESKSIGFIPKMAYESAITGVKKGKRWSDVCNDKIWVCENNSDLVGFCLSSFGTGIGADRRGKIAQICIQEDARQISRGRHLLAHVIIHGESIGCRSMGCGCADDLDSNFFWKAMGWKLVSQRKGISHTNTWKQTSDRVVNIYHYDDPMQMRLFA